MAEFGRGGVLRRRRRKNFCICERIGHRPLRGRCPKGRRKKKKEKRKKRMKEKKKARKED